ncbi:hypothetical protein ABH933_003003 [Nocardia sp. GP40]
MCPDSLREPGGLASRNSAKDVVLTLFWLALECHVEVYPKRTQLQQAQYPIGSCVMAGARRLVHTPVGGT